MPAPQTDHVIVAFSAGKDSLVTLDLCIKRFRRVDAYFMYYVKGLSVCDQPIHWAEKRYDIKVHQIPHFELPRLLRDGAYGYKERSIRLMKPVDIDDMMRDHFKAEWIASGEMKAESIERRAMLGALGESSVRDGVFDAKRRRWFPLADWSKASVYTYMRRNRIPMPAIYAYANRGFGYFRGQELKVIHDHFIDDYHKLVAVFPHLEAERIRHEQQLANA